MCVYVCPMCNCICVCEKMAMSPYFFISILCFHRGEYLRKKNTTGRFCGDRFTVNNKRHLYATLYIIISEANRYMSCDFFRIIEQLKSVKSFGENKTPDKRQHQTFTLGGYPLDSAPKIDLQTGSTIDYHCSGVSPVPVAIYSTPHNRYLKLVMSSLIHFPMT